jgi:hypothetical protein
LNGVQRNLSEAGEWLSSSPRLAGKIRSFTEWFNAPPISEGSNQSIKRPTAGKVPLFQEDFNILDQMQSPSHWQAVVLMLDEIQSDQPASERGQRLVAAGKRIYSLYDEERGSQWTTENPMSADDVMPIATYCAYSSLMHADVVLDLTDSCTESGINGYVLVTMLMAVNSAEIVSLERSSVPRLQSHLERQGVAFHGITNKKELIGLILRGRGSAALTLGKMTDALTWLTQALHYSCLAKERSICLSERSRAFCRLYRVPAALEDAHRAVELCPPLEDATRSLQEALVAADEERLRMESTSASARAARSIGGGGSSEGVEGDKIEIEKEMWVAIHLRSAAKIVWGLVVGDAAPVGGSSALRSTSDSVVRVWFVEIAAGVFIKRYRRHHLQSQLYARSIHADINSH